MQSDFLPKQLFLFDLLETWKKAAAAAVVPRDMD